MVFQPRKKMVFIFLFPKVSIKNASQILPFFVSLGMSIKNGFVSAIAVFLLFILFKSTIKGDQGQIIFVSAFILLEIIIISAVVLKRWKKS